MVRTMATKEYSFLSVQTLNGKDDENTLYKISLDELDVGTLPFGMLLDKYSDDHTKPIWELEPNLRTLKEYCVAADSYVEVRVSAEKADTVTPASNQIGNTQYCQMCEIEIPIAYTKNHIESSMHKDNVRLANYMLDKVRRQMDKLLTIDSKEAQQDRLYYCACCNAVLNDYSQSAHATTDKHKLSVKKAESLSKLIEVLLGVRSKVDNANSSKLSGGVTDRGAFAVKPIGQSHFEITADNGDIIKVLKDHWQGIIRRNYYIDCMLCNVYDLNKRNLSKHLNSKNHKQITDSVIWDRHANRKLNESGFSIWYHCVICNIIHSHRDNHIKQSSHTNKLCDALKESKQRVETKQVIEPKQSVANSKQSDDPSKQNNTDWLPGGKDFTLRLNDAKSEQSVAKAKLIIDKTKQIVVPSKVSDVQSKVIVAQLEQSVTSEYGDAKPDPSVAKSGPSVAGLEQSITKSDPNVADLGQSVAKSNQSVAGLQQNIPKLDSGPSVVELGQSVAKSDPNIADLGQSVAKSDPNVADLGQSVAKPNPSVAGLEQSVAISYRSVAGLAQSVAKSDQSIAGLKQSVAKSDQSIAGLEQSIAKSDPTVAAIEQSFAKSDSNVAVLGQKVSKSQQTEPNEHLMAAKSKESLIRERKLIILNEEKNRF